MTVKEFINKFRQLGYDEDTTLTIGAFDYAGDWHNFEFEIEDEDRKLNSDINDIAITLEPSEDYINKRINERFDINSLMDKIYDNIYYLLTHDDTFGEL
jgi:hypothetical protein